MRLTQFQVYKVARAIRVEGKQYTFIHPQQNDFGEPEETGTEISMAGLWYTTNTWQSTQGQDAGQTRVERQPCMLVLSKDGKKLSINDTLVNDGRKYRVTDTENVCELDVCYCIIFDEEQDNGKRAD